MRRFRWALPTVMVIGTLGLVVACGGGGGSDESGRWTTGDLHVHTTESDDSRVTQTLDTVLDKAFTQYGLDWMALTNHLRSSKYDNNGQLLATPVPFAYAMASHEIPRVQALQASGLYRDKLIFSGFEWDMPTHDHMGIGMFEGDKTWSTSTSGAKTFQYLFTTLNEAQFDPADVAIWKAQYPQRYNSTAADALQAIDWLAHHYPKTSYATINHPSRNPGKYTIDDLRDMNNLAPDIVFAIEGMVGNQMEPDRGGYTSAYIDANKPNRTYGGVDAMVAQVGGMWDALLGEGRHIWNIADSDSHFKIDAANNSSGYFPGEYAKNHIWVADGDTGIAGLVKSMRNGRLFGVFGDLIDTLDFKVSSFTQTAYMGQDMHTKQGEPVKITIRFKSPAFNNYEYPVNSGQPAKMKPVVDHVDLIVGDVGPKAVKGTAAYSVPTNVSTKVLKRFTAADWTVDAQGYCTVSHVVRATKSQYFRLRGTNLGTNVPDLTANGEPLADQKVADADNSVRHNGINERNYKSLWFYSNPVFVTVR